MNWDWKKLKFDSKTYGNLAQWVVAGVAVLTFLGMRPSRVYWTLVAIVAAILLPVIWILKREVYPKIAPKVLLIPAQYVRGVAFIFRLLSKTAGVAIVVLAMSFLYTDYLSLAFGEVIRSKGSIIAKRAERCIVDCIRENGEKVIITLVDSETVRKRIYKDALDQAKAKGYTDFINGRYLTPTNWISLTCIITEDEITVRDEERKSISLLYSEVLQILPENKIMKFFIEIDHEKSIFLSENERKIIQHCVNKQKENADLYSLMYMVLNDANLIRELEKTEAYNIEYYKIREYNKGQHIAEDEKIVTLSGSVVVIKKTICHLSCYDKIGVIGSYIDNLIFKPTKLIDESLKSSP